MREKDENQQQIVRKSQSEKDRLKHGKSFPASLPWHP